MKIVVMGVTGTGKSEIGHRLAYALGAPFIDGDDLHPRENVRKMARGQPLDDADRAPWLDRIGTAMTGVQGNVVVACSALKRAYRDRIRSRAGSVMFVHLTGPREVIAERMQGRKGHFMPLSLLDSQIATLEPPSPDETAIEGDIRQTPAVLTGHLLDGLRAYDT